MANPPLSGTDGSGQDSRGRFDVTVVGRRVRIPDEIKGYATERAERLGRYHLSKMEVILSSEAAGFRAEMIASSRKGGTFVARGEHQDYPGAIDLAADRLERQLSRTKGKVREKRVRKARNSITPEASPSAEDEEFYEEE